MFNLITDDRFLDTVEQHLPAHRKRQYPPTQTLAMFVAQVLSDDRSCQRIVNEHIAHCIALGLPAPSSSTSAYCDARQRLPLALIKNVCHEVARVARATSMRRGAVQPVLLIDGTGVSMPDTPANQGEFPQSASQAEGCGFPQARMVALVCASTGAVVDATLGAAKGKGTDEPAALRALLCDMPAGSTLVGDAIFENYWTWSELARADISGVFEINGSRALPKRIPKRLVLSRPPRPEWMTADQYKATPGTIEIRVVVSSKKRCRDKFLITSALDTKRQSDQQIRTLYAQRWDIEVDFRSLKDSLDAGILSCKTPDMVKRELWAHLLGYNVVRLLMCEAANVAGIQPRQISFRHAQQSWSTWVSRGAALTEENWAVLLDRIAQRRVRKRPGRREPRAIKRRPKPRALLDLPRSLAREYCHSYERTGR